MANVNITNAIKSSESRANLDSKYGPYASVAAAHAALGEEGADVVAVGLTVGIITGEREVTEYWYQGGTTQAHLVPKQSASGGGLSAPDVVSVSDAAVTIASLQGNKVYRCSTPLTSLTVQAFDSSTVEMESVIEFTTAANFTGCTFPLDSKFAPLQPVFNPSTSYVLSAQGKIWVASIVSA